MNKYSVLFTISFVCFMLRSDNYVFCWTHNHMHMGHAVLLYIKTREERKQLSLHNTEVAGWCTHDKTKAIRTRGGMKESRYGHRWKSTALISWLTGTSFMYHLVGDCRRTAKGGKTATKKYLLVRLVSNAISITRKDMTTVRPKEENLCVLECVWNDCVQ